MAKPDRKKPASKKKGPRKAGGMAGRARQKAVERESKNAGGSTVKFPSGVKASFFKAKKGTVDLDFLPYLVSISKHPEGIPKGDHWFRRDFFVHRNIGVEEMKVICPKTIGKKCPICEEYAILKSDKNADEDVVKALKPSLRQLYNVIDLNDQEKGVQLWDMSEYLFGRLLDEEIREGDEAYGGFAELEGGMSLTVRFKEQSGGDYSFTAANRIDFNDRDDYKEDMLENVHDLDAILNVMEYEDLYNMHHGIEDDEEADGGAEESEEPDVDEPEETEEETGTDDEFDDMDRKELKAYIKDNDLEIKVFKSTEDDELRESIRELVGAEPEAEEEEPEAEEEEPEEEAAEGDEFDDMDRGALKKHIKENQLDIKVFKKTEDDEIRDAIRDASAESEESEAETAPGTCPFGYTYGEDCDEFDECTECDAWEDCETKQQELKAAKRGKNKK